MLALGLNGLSDRELLALVLRSGRVGVSSLGLADEMIAEHGCLGALATARPEELARRDGVGPAKAASLAAAFELGRRMGATGDHQVVLRSAAEVARAAQAELAGARRERVLVLVCDSANRLRRTVIVSEGSIDRSLVPVREVLNAVLRHDGRAFALAHNHPSGDPEPSDADRAVTEAVAAGAKAVGLRFLGHVVVAGENWRAVN